MKDRETYSHLKTFVSQNAVVQVYIPDLTEDEKKRRIKALHNATEELLK